MQYLNLGLPKSGLESVRQALASMGVKTLAQNKPYITWRNWMDQLHRLDLLQGYPYAAYPEKVIATLQLPNLRIFYTYRPLHPWLRSCKREFSTLSQDNEENDKRHKFFGTLLYDETKFTEAWLKRMQEAQATKGCILLQIDEGTDDNYKWNQLQGLVGYHRPFPHANKSPIEKKSPYKPHELVA